MDTEDLLRIVNEVDFIRDDIDEIKGRLQLTKPEAQRLSRAVDSLEAAKSILVDLFPNMRCLSSEEREALAAELAALD